MSIKLKLYKDDWCQKSALLQLTKWYCTLQILLLNLIYSDLTTHTKKPKPKTSKPKRVTETQSAAYAYYFDSGNGITDVGIYLNSSNCTL